jgi:hypothetical protein
MKIYAAIIFLVITIFLDKKENFQIPKINKINSVSISGGMNDFNTVVLNSLKPKFNKAKEKINPFMKKKNTDGEKEFIWFL